MAEKSRYALIKILVFVALSALDIGFNAAAGAAAVATGAHVNDSPVSGRAMGIGALAGVTKAGILAFVGLLGFADLNIAAYMLLILFGSIFGIVVLVTLQVANTALGETPSQLLIAAIVAAIPLQGEGLGMYFSLDNYYKNDGNGNEETNLNFGGFLSLLGLDALGGYVFARMARNQGIEICALNAAAAAGAVFGALAMISKFVAYCTWACIHLGGLE
ncbi:hypothetical protein VTI74DRAFT_1482 [Chaetomium olivicolor]